MTAHEHDSALHGRPWPRGEPDVVKAKEEMSDAEDEVKAESDDANNAVKVELDDTSDAVVASARWSRPASSRVQSRDHEDHEADVTPRVGSASAAPIGRNDPFVVIDALPFLASLVDQQTASRSYAAMRTSACCRWFSSRPRGHDETVEQYAEFKAADYRAGLLPYQQQWLEQRQEKWLGPLCGGSTSMPDLVQIFQDVQSITHALAWKF